MRYVNMKTDNTKMSVMLPLTTGKFNTSADVLSKQHSFFGQNYQKLWILAKMSTEEDR